MMKKIVLILIFFLLLVNTVFAIEKQQIYMPYPIIFVSGIQTSDNSASKGYPSRNWPEKKVFKELKKYFLVDPDKATEVSKYAYEGVEPGTNEKSHLEFFFYDAQQATLATNADLLQKQIRGILFGDDQKKGYYDVSSYTYTEPCSTPKVILVCHSLGGLIARKMLVDNKDNIRDKVAAVFFIGTQQEGSPLGVVAYFLPKEITALREDIDNINALIDGAGYLRRRALLNVRQREESKITGNLQLMRWAETEDEVPGFPIPGLYVSTRDNIDNAQLREALANTRWLAFLENELPEVSEKGVIKGTLINSELANSYRHTFEAYSFNGPFGTGIGARVVRAVPEDGPLTYKLSEGVFSNPAVDRNIGDINAHAIAGNLGTVLRLGFCAAANSLMGWDNFNTRDYSCIANRFWESGDGFSNLASQEAIVPAANVHEIRASHISFPSTLGELDHPATPNIILQAIDDAPVIESAYCVRSYPSSYIIIKVKDYLLADIEIAGMTVNSQAVDLNEFKDPVTSTYKPYVKFGKDFLKERPVALDYGRIKLNLSPGEFYVPVTIPSDLYGRTGNQAIYFKLKNPAQKEAEAAVFLPDRRWIVKGGYLIPASVSYDNTWEFLQSYYHNHFLNNGPPKQVFTFQRYQDVGICHSFSGRFHGYYEGKESWEWQGNLSVVYSYWLNFYLNIQEKDIKSIKFVHNFYKGIKGGGKDFNLIILRDTSDAWPPDLNSSGDTALFTFNTSSLPNVSPLGLYSQNSPILEPPKTIDTPIEDINTFGYNIWQIKPNPDIPEEDIILEPIFYNPAPPLYGEEGAEAIFYQYIYTPHNLLLPSLLVTFEEPQQP